MPFAETISGSFYQIQNLVSRTSLQILFPESLYTSSVMEYSENYQYYREVYTLVDCLGDLGGLFEIIVVFVATLYRPYSYHSYILKIIKRLFVAKTKKDDMFKKAHHHLTGGIL
jgi:hypothetical protein